MIKIGLLGTSGAIGQLLVKSLCDSKDIQHKNICLSVVHVRNTLSSLLSQKLSKDVIVTNSINELLDNCDVVVDFSTQQATLELLQKTLKANIKKSPIALVICTTGLGANHLELIKKNSAKIPILQASNTSLGVCVLNKLAKQASKILKEYDCEILEYHHNKKIDSPSGTALSLANTCAMARNLELDKVRISKRDGLIGARDKNEIGVMAIRGGDMAGKHIVGFYGDGEYVELTHNANSKQTFVNGALACVKFLANKTNGIYDISDVVSL